MSVDADVNVIGGGSKLETAQDRFRELPEQQQYSESISGVFSGLRISKIGLAPAQTVKRLHSPMCCDAVLRIRTPGPETPGGANNSLPA